MPYIIEQIKKNCVKKRVRAMLAKDNLKHGANTKDNYGDCVVHLQNKKSKWRKERNAIATIQNCACNMKLDGKRGKLLSEGKLNACLV